MDLKKVFTPDCCLVLKEEKKTEALIEMMDNILDSGRAENGEELKKEIFYREQLMSTGIGMGIAVPHIRYKGVTEPVAALGLSPEGIDDYESIDGIPVKIIVMIIVGENQHKQHIRLLSQIMERLKDPSMREALLKLNKGKDIYNLITEEKHHD